MAEETERMLRIEEVADRLAIGRSKMFELLAEGRIKSVRIDRARRIPQSEYDRFVASLTNDAA